MAKPSTLIFLAIGAASIMAFMSSNHSATSNGAKDAKAPAQTAAKPHAAKTAAVNTAKTPAAKPHRVTPAAKKVEEPQFPRSAVVQH